MKMRVGSNGYFWAERQLKTARSEASGKPIANNTRLFRRGPEAIAMRLHDTDVVTFYLDGSFVLDSGGWKTVTTKDRMNGHGAQVYSDRGTWFVKYGGDNYLFEDGMRFYPEGEVRGANGRKLKPWVKGESSAKAKRERKLRAQVASYAKAFVEKLYKGEIDAPSAGDCFYCVGKFATDKDHLLSHLKEKYFVPSLLYRAAEVMGCSTAEKSTIHALTHGETQGVWPMGYIRQGIEKRLRRYILRQLGLAA